ncbi:PAS domain S-box protein, partial [Methanoregula sp.]|uniref:PAS domain S-box protein n=1 Tax=Methanoregula sp. TaxID=2052170 RepID=UPI000CA68E00
IEDFTRLRRDPAGKITHDQGIVLDITGRKRAEDRLNYRLELEKLISTISASFINLEHGDIDPVITMTLQSIGTLTGVDRSYIFLFAENGTLMHNTHEWCAEGIIPQLEKNQGVRSDLFPWWMERLSRYEAIHIPRVTGLPPEAGAEREILQARGVRSIIAVPLVYGGTLTGFLGFESVRQEKTWAEEDIGLLRTTGEILSNAIEHRKTEKALAASEEKFRGVAERSSDIIQLTDRMGRITYVSPSIRRVFGFDPEEVIGSPPEELVHPDDIGSVLELIRETMTGTGGIKGIETRVRKKGGGYAILEVFVSPVIKDGIFSGLQVMARDITERRRAEEEISSLKKQIEYVLGATNTGLDIIDRDFNIRYIDPE